VFDLPRIGKKLPFFRLLASQINLRPTKSWFAPLPLFNLSQAVTDGAFEPFIRNASVLHVNHRENARSGPGQRLSDNFRSSCPQDVTAIHHNGRIALV